MEHYENINRTALVVSPKKPFLDWIQSVDPMTPMIEEKHDSNLKKHFKEIFEQELGAWFTDPAMWPADRSWRVFTEWLDFEFQSMIYDTMEDPIDKE